jgi:hypothetical protein
VDLLRQCKAPHGSLRHHEAATATATAAAAVALAAATAVDYLAVLGWDLTKDRDPVTGALTGPCEFKGRRRFAGGPFTGLPPADVSARSVGQ